MPSHWPLRTKLKLGLGVFLIAILALFGSAVYGLYAYRGLVRSLSCRSAELPLASDIQQRVNDLRVILSQANERVEPPLSIQTFPDATTGDEESSSLPWDAQMLQQEYRMHLASLVEAINRYRRQLNETSLDRDLQLGDDSLERETLSKIDELLVKLGGGDSSSHLGENWVLSPGQIEYIRNELDKMRSLVAELPSYLHTRLLALSDNVRAQYRTALTIAWSNVGIAIVLLFISIRGFIRWFAEPLQTLVEGSRQVALGKFDHRIHLDSSDEMGELAVAMNNMTARFQEIRDDLDRQVRERTSQVVRSEQLASVGFLAAGVAHEINNPLASIALCSESLDSRIEEMMDQADSPCKEHAPVIHNYLQMIQREAFRCKQITEKLLDFARMGDSQRVNTDLRELVAGVIDMVQHLGKHKDKHLELAAGPPVIVEINAQEIKQVVLNLITNGLESLDSTGKVNVSVEQTDDWARIVVEDNGCGMSEEVRKHLFEPFFTRRRGGQGTGLGLSITYRIVEEHDGNIEAMSEGAGCGSRFVVSLPSQQTMKEKSHHYQAA
ncbi:ATP-binding protein [Bythopirellula polymerisocia]|uniref:histidine kinase n=1 Tax=Bythopirellula polymerisocia TaxID=2528003 RepID=A0A5C6CHU2_9BACT|nr:ATP-binding protein [Bythopirellula polymerisocia]TWU23615.1 Sensor protein ZraS [Bythopirellula polymerisocia]